MMPSHIFGSRNKNCYYCRSMNFDCILFCRCSFTGSSTYTQSKHGRVISICEVWSHWYYIWAQICLIFFKCLIYCHIEINKNILFWTSKSGPPLSAKVKNNNCGWYHLNLITLHLRVWLIMQVYSLSSRSMNQEQWPPAR